MRCSAPQSALLLNLLVSPKRYGAPPRALPPKQSAGAITPSVIASAKRIEKGAWKMEGKLACNPDSGPPFSYSLP